MTPEHPITPPLELVEQWIAQIWHEGTPVKVAANDLHVATQAARWGADQELEECCEILRGEFNYHHIAEPLRSARRPKPPSLAEEAVEQLSSIRTAFKIAYGGDLVDTFIRRALERLKELEKGNE